MTYPARKNITVVVPFETYRQIRIWAADHNTSISRVVQDFLRQLPELSMKPAPPRRPTASKPAKSAPTAAQNTQNT